MRISRKLSLWFGVAVLAVAAAGCSSSTTSSSNNNNNNNNSGGSSGSSGPSTLWVANETGPSMDSYASTDLASGGSISPTATISGANTQFTAPFCSAVDGSGNLWVVDFVGSKQPGAIMEFAASDAAKGGDLTPAVTISGSNTTLVGPAGCAFDSKGNFWVADDDNLMVVGFTPSELATGGNIAPAVELTNSNDICNTVGLAFDGNGNLWVSNLCYNDAVEFLSADLSASGDVTPAVRITNLNQPYALAFDKSGNLWVTANADNSVEEFLASDLTPSGSNTPAATISGSNTLMDRPVGLGFDGSGNLWVAQQASNTLTMYSAADLSAGGNVAPSTTVLGANTNLAGPAGILFH